MALLYAVIYSSALEAPSDIQVIAGHTVNDTPAVWAGYIEAPVSSGPFTWPSAATGLEEGTNYRIAIVWTNYTETAISDVAVSEVFTTTSDGPVTIILVAATTISGAVTTISSVVLGGSIEGIVPTLTNARAKTGSITSDGWISQVTAS